MGRFDPLMIVAHAAVGQADALVGLVRQLRILAQRRHGGDHFEGRAGRIEAVARAVQVGVRIRRRRGRRHPAAADSSRPPAGRPWPGSITTAAPLLLPACCSCFAQDLRHLHLQPRIDRHANIARAVEHAPHRRDCRARSGGAAAAPVRGNRSAARAPSGRSWGSSLPPAWAGRHSRAGGAPNRAPRKKCCWRPSGVRVRRSPSRSNIRPPKRIVAAVAARAGAVDIDAELLVFRAVLLQFVPVAGGQRQAVAVVDGALGDLAHHILEARIVLVAARAIGLHHQRALRPSRPRCAATWT